MTVYEMSVALGSDEPPYTPIGIGRNVGFFLAVLTWWHDKDRDEDACILHIPTKKTVGVVRGHDTARAVAKEINKIVPMDKLALADDMEVAKAFPGHWRQYMDAQWYSLWQQYQSYTEWRGQQC